MGTDSVPHNHVVIIGTGFGAIATAVRLQRTGFDDFVLIDWADDVGGVWRDNDYPGAAVDVKSHLYSLSFGPNIGTGHNSVLQMLAVRLHRRRDRPRQRPRSGRRAADPDRAGRLHRRGRTDERRDGVDGGRLSELVPERERRNVNIWPGTTFDFRRRTRRFDPAAHQMKGALQDQVGRSAPALAGGN
jgi:phytoene dehydrogenase-like protein